MSRLNQTLGPRVSSSSQLSNNGESKSISITIPIQNSSEKKEDLYIFGLDINRFPKSVQFFLCTIGVFFFYLIYGYFQELLFKLEGFRPFGLYLTWVQFLYYTLFGLCELKFKEDKTRKIPLKTYSIIAFLTVGTMALSNSSVGYLNYPTQVIFKCCKLVPVLIGGIIIQGKSFSKIDWAACLSMSIGLILFTLADNSVSPNFNAYGILLISLALCADAAIGNVQEKAMKHFSASNSEMVLYSYAIGFIYIFIGLIVKGELVPAFQFCSEHPVKTYFYILIFSITGYIGINFVLLLVKIQGALIAVTITTCRKAITIILSFLFFTKPFTFNYIWAGMVVALGIYLNIYSKNQAKFDKIFLEFKQRYIDGKRPIRTFSSPANIV